MNQKSFESQIGSQRNLPLNKKFTSIDRKQQFPSGSSLLNLSPKHPDRNPNFKIKKRPTIRDPNDTVGNDKASKSQSWFGLAFLKKADMFGRRVTLLYDERNTFTTFCGFFLTMILMIGLVAFAYWEFKKVFIGELKNLNYYISDFEDYEMSFDSDTALGDDMNGSLVNKYKHQDLVNPKELGIGKKENFGNRLLSMLSLKGTTGENHRHTKKGFQHPSYLKF